MTQSLPFSLMNFAALFFLLFFNRLSLFMVTRFLNLSGVRMITLIILTQLFIRSNIFQSWFFVFFRVKRLLSYFRITSMNSTCSNLFMRILLSKLRLFNNLGFIWTVRRWSMSRCTNHCSFIMTRQVLSRRRSSQRRRQSLSLSIRCNSINQFTILVNG